MNERAGTRSNALTPRLAAALLIACSACGGDRTIERVQLAIGVGADRYLTELASRPDLGKYPLNAGVFDTLVRMDERFQVEPMLAERWTYDRPANTYRFTLRRGVRFHDGAELTSDDVKYTFDLIIASYPHNYEELGPASVVAADRYVVAVTPVKTNQRLVEQIAHPIWGINRQKSHPLQPVGTGPFRFVSYEKNTRLVVDRFEGYWNPLRVARARRLTFQFVGDPQARVLAARGRQLDLVSDVPPPLIPALERPQSALQILRSEVGTFDALSFNIHGRPPFTFGSDPVVRQAVGLAIDRAAVVRSAWGTAAELSTTWIPPAVLGAHAALILPPAYDAARAEGLLDAAGWRVAHDGIREKNGRRLSLAYTVSFPTSEHRTAPELIQRQLRNVGIETRIELMADAGVSGAMRRGGNYDIVHLTGNQNEPYPCFLPDLQYYSKSQAASTQWTAPGGATDRAIEACRAAVDTAAARRHAAEAIHELVDVEHILIPIAGLRRIWAAGKDVRGFVPHPSDTNQRWEGVYRAR
ncbi:MAG TPA: ABC transporter substrate-binding protein [Vicinamibacterales bacterium]|nr:ABC transporter substrate-binding protein [Vicinamibacterales bacterium]